MIRSQVHFDNHISQIMVLTLQAGALGTRVEGTGSQPGRGGGGVPRGEFGHIRGGEWNHIAKIT